MQQDSDTIATPHEDWTTQYHRPLGWQYTRLVEGQYAIRIAYGEVIYCMVLSQPKGVSADFVFVENHSPILGQNAFRDWIHRSEFLTIVTEEMYQRAAQQGWRKFSELDPLPVRIGSYVVGLVDGQLTVSKVYSVDSRLGVVKGAHFNPRHPDGFIGTITTDSILAAVPREMFHIAHKNQWVLNTYARQITQEYLHSVW